jgi:hypothetical protein
MYMKQNRACLTTLSTPLGSPASLASTQSARADMGVSSAGLIVTLQPAARAGPSLRVIMAEGKFQGVMKAAGPTGWRGREGGE